MAYNYILDGLRPVASYFSYKPLGLRPVAYNYILDGLRPVASSRLHITYISHLVLGPWRLLGSILLI